MAEQLFALVLMPFAKSFDDIYQFGIKATLEAAGVIAERIDEQIFHDERILERIYNQIEAADFIVADMTGRNPNVFYEVGYAHAKGKQCILLTSDPNDIPFDLKHYRHVIYDDSIDKLANLLSKELKKVKPSKKQPIFHRSHEEFDKKREYYIDEAEKPVNLYISVGVFANAGSQITLRMKSRHGNALNINLITIVRLHPEVVKRLQGAGLLHDNFEELLQRRIADFISDVAKDKRKIRIAVRFWSDVPDFHGYVFSNRRFTNSWHFEGGKMHVDTPLFEYPSPDYDDEIMDAIGIMEKCELEGEYLDGKRIT